MLLRILYKLLINYKNICEWIKTVGLLEIFFTTRTYVSFHWFSNTTTGTTFTMVSLWPNRWLSTGKVTGRITVCVRYHRHFAKALVFCVRLLCPGSLCSRNQLNRTGIQFDIWGSGLSGRSAYSENSQELPSFSMRISHSLSHTHTYTYITHVQLCKTKLRKCLAVATIGIWRQPKTKFTQVIVPLIARAADDRKLKPIPIPYIMDTRGEGYKHGEVERHTWSRWVYVNADYGIGGADGGGVKEGIRAR